MLTHEELLHKERLSILLHIKNRNRTFHRYSYPNPKKDGKVSTSLRKQGNLLYIQLRNNNALYDQQPERVWHKYTKSILYAPNDSEELAFGYGNRSAMMFYFCAFEDCIRECDTAISITSSNCLIFKLLCRKAQSLSSLNRSAKEVCNKALQLLETLNLEATKKKHYEKQLHLLIIASNLISADSEACKKKNYAKALMNFQRSQEVPCASKSIAIQYNQKWGRHIVATEDIPAGKIIAVEEHFFSYKYDKLYCNNCHKYIFLRNSLPCKHCVYNIYCSESCRKEAWDNYHQFQCYIPFLNFIESIKFTPESGLKFILLVIHQAGGIEHMKQQLLEIENIGDPRIKGFSEGIFQDGKLINFFSLECCKEGSLEEKTRFAYLENSCLYAYLLAEHTNFFGEKMDLLETEMFLNEDILFIASLFLRFYYTSHRNMNVIISKNDHKSEVFVYYAPFGSLFNHSCDPNVKQLVNYRIVYINQYPIQKGSQLFLAYDNNIFDQKDKESRQKDLQKKCNFTCDCIACTENWSCNCLPSLKYVLEIIPSLQNSIPTDTDILLAKVIGKYGFLTEFKPKIAKKVLGNMKLLSKNFTVYCVEYFALEAYLEMMYAAALFDNFIIVKEVCEPLF